MHFNCRIIEVAILLFLTVTEHNIFINKHRDLKPRVVAKKRI